MNQFPVPIRPLLALLLSSLFLLSPPLFAAEDFRISSAVLDRMQTLMRQGLDEQFHGAYDAARDKMVAAYVTLLTARRDEVIQSHVKRVSTVYPQLTTAQNRLEYIVSVVGYEPLDVGVSIPISLAEIDETVARYREALETVRKALLSAPDWLRAQYLGTYVGGLHASALWAARTTVAGRKILTSAAPYDLEG